MDKALVYGTRDSGFDPQYGRVLTQGRYFGLFSIFFLCFELGLFQFSLRKAVDVFD